MASYRQEGPNIFRVYNEPGVSWREAKKQLRQYFLDRAAEVRAMRKEDAVQEHPEADFDPETLHEMEMGEVLSR